MVALAEVFAQALRHKINFAARKLIKVEEKTKHVPWEMDRTFELSAAKLSALSIDLAKARVGFTYSQLYCDFIRRLSQKASRHMSDFMQAPDGGTSVSGSKVLQERFLSATAHCDYLSLYIGCDQQRAEVQRDVVSGYSTFHSGDLHSKIYNLLAREDSALSTRVAEYSSTIALATKRDSDSMKTMAALTMFFLPGTWAAALFAMPLFDWSAQPGEAVINERLWIYWALVAPLTMLVLLLWWGWKEWRSRRDIALEALAKSRFQQNVETSKTAEGSPEARASGSSRAQ